MTDTMHTATGPAPKELDVPERRDFGHIYQRGAVYWIRYSVDGKRYRESTKSTSERQAQKMLDRKQAELGIGAFTEPAVKRTTLKDLAELLRQNYVAKDNRSLPRAEDAIVHLTAHFGAAARATAIRDRIGEYESARLTAGAARSTINYELAILRRMFRLGVKAKRVIARLEIELTEPKNRRRGFFEADDFEALAAALPDYLAPVVTFAYYTGWRIPSEVPTRQWRHVDFREGIVRLEPGETKSGEGRSFPFSALPALKALLEKQRARVTAVEKAKGVIIPWVFPSSVDPQLPIRHFRRAWRSALRRAATVQHENGLTEVVRPELLDRIPHDLRRTAVRNLVRAGVPERVAMQLTGHETRSVFERYNIVNERDLSDGVTKLAALHDARAVDVTARRGTLGAH